MSTATQKNEEAPKKGAAPKPSTPKARAKPRAPRKPKPKPKPTSDAAVAELAAQFAAYKAETEAQIEALKQAAKRPALTLAQEQKREYRPEAEIVGAIDVSEVAEDDWRAPYHGAIVSLARFKYEGGTMIAQPEDGRLDCLLSIPSDLDYGGNGAALRTQGYMTVNWAKAQGDQWQVKFACHMTEAELDEIWPED